MEPEKRVQISSILSTEKARLLKPVMNRTNQQIAKQKKNRVIPNPPVEWTFEEDQLLQSLFEK